MVALHEAIDEQVALDGFDRADDARIVGGQEAHEREHQAAGVELGRAVVLREGTDGRVVALLADLAMHVVAQVVPLGEGLVGPTGFAQLHPAVDGDPRHHLRVHEVATWAADLPDAVVGLGPDLLDVLDENAGQVPDIVGQFVAAGNDGSAGTCP